MRKPAVRQQEGNVLRASSYPSAVPLVRAETAAVNRRRPDLERLDSSRLNHRRPVRQGPAATGLRHRRLLGLLAALALLASVLAGCGSSGDAESPAVSTALPWIGHAVRVEEGRFLFTSSAPGLPSNEAVWVAIGGELELPPVGQKVSVDFQGGAIATSYPGQGTARVIKHLQEEGEPFAGASLTTAEAIRRALEQLPELAVPVVQGVVYAADDASWTVRLEDDQAKDERVQEVRIPDAKTPAEQGASMTGHVVRIDKGGFLLTGEGGPSGNALSVTSPVSVELGQQVRVRIDGGINESYPAQAKAASVERIDSGDPQKLVLSRSEAIRRALKQTHAAVPVIVESSYQENGASWTVVIQDGMDAEAEPESIGIRVDASTAP